MKRTVVFSILIFLTSLTFISCPYSRHCDIRFCEFTPTLTGDLEYTPVLTIFQPVGHTLNRSTVNKRYERYPESDVQYTIGNVDKWQRDDSFYYIVPQVFLNRFPDRITGLLSGDAFWNDYRYDKDEFYAFCFDEYIDGVSEEETPYYCLFSGHKAVEN